MPPDASGTKARIFRASLEEFAAHGFAGARMDRIAATASANKRSLYAHYGNKEQLFDLVVAQTIREMAAAVPFTAHDLGDYAARLFDYLLEHPQALRLTFWAHLERSEPESGQLATYRPKVEAIAEAQCTGVIRNRSDPADLLALVLGITTSWAGASPALRSLAEDADGSPRRIARHRSALVDAVRDVSRGAGD